MAAHYVCGPLTLLGLVVALLTTAADQALKLWLIFVFELGRRGSVALGPYVDLILSWNTGISYGLFRQHGELGRWGLLVVTVIVLTFLWVWLARAASRLSAVALGLIIGGAIGNAIDRVAYGAVVDFVLVHITTATSRFDWYVFNLADAAIVAGVIGLGIDSLTGRNAAKAP
jgi:signal peptidase II